MFWYKRPYKKGLITKRHIVTYGLITQGLNDKRPNLTKGLKKTVFFFPDWPGYVKRLYITDFTK